MEHWIALLARAQAAASAALAQAGDAWDDLDQATDGKLWLVALGVALFVAIMAVPPPKGAEPAMAAARALTTVALIGVSLVLFLAH